MGNETMSEISDVRAGQPAWRQRAVMRSLGAAHTRAEQQIDQFLDAAFALIDERGAADFTIREVSERCDQSIRRFYQYFDGKDELLLALFEVSVLEQAGDLRQTVEEHTEPLDRLRAFTTRLYEWCEPADSTEKPGTHTYRPIADFAVQLSTVHPARVEAAMEPISLLLLELLEEAAAAGVVRVESVPRAALLVKQLVMFSWFRNRVIQDPELRISADEMWDFCLRGIGA
jgi:AcrR family transcriptional regulator